MVDAETYLMATGPAIKHMFQALSEYDEATIPPVFGAYVTLDGAVVMDLAQAERYIRELAASAALDFAKATLYGSIVQVAHMAILSFSRNVEISSRCEALGVTAGGRVAKFCVGRTVHDIPIGLLIYATRIQYNHWDEGTCLSNKVAKCVFSELVQAHYWQTDSDLAYELDLPQRRPVAHHVVRHELCWTNYEQYLVDMREILLPPIG